MHVMRFVLTSLLVLCALSCGKSDPPREVVLYSSVDEPYVTPLIKTFAQQTGVHVRFVPDTEANKSAGLAERIEAEKDHPRADVYWGNEIFHTINLAEHGIFTPYQPASAKDVPAKWRAKDDLFVGIGLRARMIVVTTKQPVNVHGLNDLTKPELKGKIGLSHPGFGTASGHIAALYVV